MLHTLVKKTIWALFFAVCIVSCAAAEMQFYPLIDADLRAGYSSLKGGNSSWGGTGWLFAMPSLQFDDDNFLMLAYDVNMSQNENVIEEQTIFLKRIGNFFSLIGKHKFSKNWDVKINADGRYNLNLETKDETWGNGLYDYYDFGGGAGVSYTFLKDEREHPVSFSFKYYQRQYPNYKSLGAETSTIDKEKKPKDFNGFNFLLKTKQELSSRLEADCSYNLLLKYFIDSYLRTDQGLISDEKRMDNVHYLDLNLTHLTGENIFLNGLLNLTYYGSNASIYDSDYYQYVPAYYSYFSFAIAPGINMRFFKKLNVGFNYSFLKRFYTERPVRDTQGNYGTEKQNDTEHTVQLNYAYTIFESFSVSGGFSYLIARSNQKYEPVVEYSYDIFSMSLGVSFKY